MPQNIFFIEAVQDYLILTLVVVRLYPSDALKGKQRVHLFTCDSQLGYIQMQQVTKPFEFTFGLYLKSF